MDEDEISKTPLLTEEQHQHQKQQNEYIDKITLELLLNKNHYSKYLAKTDPKRYDEFKDYKSKLRKYSIDIVDITSQLIEHPKTQYSKEIEETFEIYTKSIFKYYEMKDLENANEYNKKEVDDDIMFDKVETVTPSIQNSFWSRERVIKKKVAPEKL